MEHNFCSWKPICEKCQNYAPWKFGTIRYTMYWADWREHKLCNHMLTWFSPLPHFLSSRHHACVCLICHTSAQSMHTTGHLLCRHVSVGCSFVWLFTCRSVGWTVQFSCLSALYLQAQKVTCVLPRGVNLPSALHSYGEKTWSAWCDRGSNQASQMEKSLYPVPWLTLRPHTTSTSWSTFQCPLLKGGALWQSVFEWTKIPLDDVMPTMIAQVCVLVFSCRGCQTRARTEPLLKHCLCTCERWTVTILLERHCWSVPCPPDALTSHFNPLMLCIEIAGVILSLVFNSSVQHGVAMCNAPHKYNVVLYCNVLFAIVYIIWIVYTCLTI